MGNRPREGGVAVGMSMSPPPPLCVPTPLTGGFWAALSVSPIHVCAQWDVVPPPSYVCSGGDSPPPFLTAPSPPLLCVCSGSAARSLTTS